MRACGIVLGTAENVNGKWGEASAAAGPGQESRIGGDHPWRPAESMLSLPVALAQRHPAGLVPQCA